MDELWSIGSRWFFHQWFPIEVISCWNSDSLCVQFVSHGFMHCRFFGSFCRAFLLLPRILFLFEGIFFLLPGLLLLLPGILLLSPGMFFELTEKFFCFDLNFLGMTVVSCLRVHCPSRILYVWCLLEPSARRYLRSLKYLPIERDYQKDSANIPRGGRFWMWGLVLKVDPQWFPRLVGITFFPYLDYRNYLRQITLDCAECRSPLRWDIDKTDSVGWSEIQCDGDLMGWISLTQRFLLKDLIQFDGKVIGSDGRESKGKIIRLGGWVWQNKLDFKLIVLFDIKIVVRIAMIFRPAVTGHHAERCISARRYSWASILWHPFGERATAHARC